MSTTYDVRFWKTEVWQGKKTATHTVRWVVAGKPFKEPFKHSALADSFRAQLLSAAKSGEAFVVETGLPVSMQRAENDMSWFEFACSYVDMKWDESAGNSRKGVAEMLANATTAMLSTSRGKPDDKTIRHALNGWAFNKKRRVSADCPEDVRLALKWLAANTSPVSSLQEAAKIRAVLGQLSKKLDDTRAAPATIRRKRAVLFNTMEYAVELKLLPKNPIPALKWKVPKPTKSVDKRVVVNPKQAVRLLDSVRKQHPSGNRLVAFFATMYYSGARPGEAVNLRKQDLLLPSATWNEEHQRWDLPTGLAKMEASCCCRSQHRRPVRHGARRDTGATSDSSSIARRATRDRSPVRLSWP